MLSVVHGIITLKFCLCHYRIQIQRSEVVHLVGVGYPPENIENGARPRNGSWSQEGQTSGMIIYSVTSCNIPSNG